MEWPSKSDPDSTQTADSMIPFFIFSASQVDASWFLITPSFVTVRGCAAGDDVGPLNPAYLQPGDGSLWCRTTNEGEEQLDEIEDEDDVVAKKPFGKEVIGHGSAFRCLDQVWSSFGCTA